jgi:methionyl-tRNA formyltransferase
LYTSGRISAQSLACEPTAGNWQPATTLGSVRTVYLGTSPFAVAVLERLAASDHRPSLVVTRPDRPRGRGRKVAPPPAADAARRRGIEVFQPDSVNSEESLARIAAEEPEAVLICAFGALIKEPLLSAYPMYNVHPSLLPRWRGAAPIERAIESGDRETGVSIMRPTAEMDAGPVCLQAGEPILPDDDFASLSARLEGLGGDLLVNALDRRPEFAEQPAEGVTIADKIGPEDRRLDPSGSPDELERSPRTWAHTWSCPAASALECAAPRWPRRSVRRPIRASWPRGTGTCSSAPEAAPSSS